MHVLVTGASSGFGALTVRALGARGHTVFAGMRDLQHRNAAAAAALGDEPGDLRAVELDVTDQASVDAGQRPLRTHVDPSRDGSEVVSAVADRIRVEFFRRAGIDDLLTPNAAL